MTFPQAEAYRSKILPLRAQMEVRNRWLRERLEIVLPEVMRRAGIDMWIVAAREYNEDPVIMTLLPEPSMAARRRTILVFALNPNGTLDRLTLDRYGFGEFYQSSWNPDAEEQYACLGRIVRERDPHTIGINTSDTFAYGDGLTHNEYQHLARAIGDDYMDRVVDAEKVTVGWLERRIQPELMVYPGIAEIGHAIIAEAFSSRIIQPGITTTDDVVWWMRDTMQSLGLRAWFMPTIDIQAPGETFEKKEGKRKLILPGDLLHCDMGFYYLGLATDHQQNAYILKPGETDAPAGLKAALADGNRLQDIHMAAMGVGRTGNQVLADALAQAQGEGINATIYSHPLGYHGHAAGPTIGLWDQQGGVPGRGDYPIFDDTCYSIELNAKRAVPEWDNQLVQLALEEDAVMTGGRMHWLTGRQTELFLIR